MEQITPQMIAGAVGVALALLFAYFPVLRVKYAALQSEVKSGIMLGLYAVFTVAIYFLALYQVIPVVAPANWFSLVSIFFALVTLGQPTYMVLPQASDVKDAKVVRDYATVEKVLDPK